MGILGDIVGWILEDGGPPDNNDNLSSDPPEEGAPDESQKSTQR